MSARKKRRKKRKSHNPGVSTVQSKRNGSRNHTDGPTAGTSQAVPSLSTNEINRLISKGKAKAAVTKAKLYHKSLGTDESKMILVNAYAVRIREMISKGYFLEAKTLLELIRERYNCPDLLLAELNGFIAIHEGRVDELVRPLDDPGISPERRTTIERIIKNELVDLNLLAQSKFIASDHQLKTGAQAVVEAFAKVTTGLEQDEEISLAAVSRRSPLAPWKMLIKAIAFFYRHDDAVCEKYLQAVEPQSAPGRLVPLIRAMIADKSTGNQDEKSSPLVNKVCGNNKQVRNALRLLDNTLTAKKPRKLFKATRKAVNICRQNCPEILESLKQHISIRSWVIGIDAGDVNRALGEPSLKNACFWRLHARAAELKDSHLWACAMLEEFRKHALHEGWFSDKDQEVSAIYLYMAGLLKRLPEEEFEWLQSEFEDEFVGFESYYRDQPGDILEAVRTDTVIPSDTYYLYPEILYRLACEIDRSAETFRQWLEWVENQQLNWKKCDEVALAWHAAFPEDTRPLLYLMKSAEKRSAFKKAIGYLNTAERIDGLNPDVKRARPRLWVATAVRHLKQKKTHLAQNDIVEIEQFQQSGEGDLPAFVVALQIVCALIDGEKSKLIRLNRELISLLEHPVAANVVIQGLLSDCNLSDTQTDLSLNVEESIFGDNLVAAIARGCKIADDMGIAASIPPEYEKKLRDFFYAQNNSLDPANIRIVAETALRSDDFQLAYAATGAGLMQPADTAARLLLLRARSLPIWEVDRRSDCIAAAIELARRARDMDLINEAVELHRVGKRGLFGFSFFGNTVDEGNFSLEAEELDAILRTEKEAREYPSMMPSAFDDFDEDDASKCRYCDVKNCPDRDAPYLPDGLDSEAFDDDDDDINEFPDFNEFLNDNQSHMPPDLVTLIKKVFLKYGDNGFFPDRQEVARKDPWLADQLLREMQTAESAGIFPDFYRLWFRGW
ncbi:MAG: hypothetical protein GY850_15600 [bacterium]|nr:hypothetical protein [bacterium]